MNTNELQNSGPRLLGKQDLAETLGISVRTIENLVKANELPPGVRLGRYVFWTETVIAKWRRERFAAQERWNPLTA